MSACEKCWRDAGQIYAMGQGRGESHVAVYHELLEERRENPCTIEEQGGTVAAFNLRCTCNAGYHEPYGPVPDCPLHGVGGPNDKFW